MSYYGYTLQVEGSRIIDRPKKESNISMWTKKKID